jgi:hypothetical protein
MATILPFPAMNVVPVWGLTEQECDAVHEAAFPLMHYGQSTGVSVHNDGQYMCVFDRRGEPYSIGREEGVCYLANSEESMVVYSRQFEDVLEALLEMLSPTPYIPT